PGVRSLQIHFDQRHSIDSILKVMKQVDRELPEVDAFPVKSRVVHLPLSWDDPSTVEAIAKYDATVRKDAPWFPSNIEFIRRINGLDSIEDVRSVVFDASYVVLGLGDVYLGAPVATPLDPRHRLVTTKYNPARTWTPENAVGIGGAYLCIYGMEGPGGYQFVGRTLQMWNRYRSGGPFTRGKPWLLRFFDQIRFFPVSHEELREIRRDFLRGRYDIRIEETSFQLGSYETFLQDEAASISNFRTRQQQAFDAERERWVEADDLIESELPVEGPDGDEDVPDGLVAVPSPLAGNLWKLVANDGDTVEAGKEIAIIESMKMEMTVQSPFSGIVRRVLVQPGMPVQPGQAILYLEESDD
ncbi:MAG: carboxyltransferase domain-containing protein, partial [Verrucomicrobiota bacterium]